MECRSYKPQHRDIDFGYENKIHQSSLMVYPDKQIVYSANEINIKCDPKTIYECKIWNNM